MKKKVVIYLKNSPSVRTSLAMKGITATATPTTIDTVMRHEIFIIGTEGFFHGDKGNPVYYPPHEIIKIELVT